MENKKKKVKKVETAEKTAPEKTTAEKPAAKTKKLSKGKITAIVITAIVVILLGTLFTYAGTYDKIFNGVYVLDTDLSGLTQKEAEDLLFVEYFEKEPKATIKYNILNIL